MREILFRGKDMFGKWIQGDLLQYLGSRILHIAQNYTGAGGQEVVPETVGQYTGITDDNGKKIFEGDILKVVNNKYKKTYITKVCTYFNTLCVNPNGKYYEFTPIGFENAIWDDESYEIEVIGNIYDNPELLEVEK